MSTSFHTTTAQELITQRRHRATPARIQVLDILLHSATALSHHDIEAIALQDEHSCNRVTIYRTLEWLVKNELAHRINGPDRTWLYNAQLDITPHHAHFQCRECEQVYCLDQFQPSLLVKLPSGYQLEEAELNLQGRCPECTSDPS